MDDMKDKVKGFMKKVNNPFTSSSSGRFKGQGRVLGSSSSSSSSATTGTVNSIPNRRIPGLDSSKQNVTPANSSNSRATAQKPSGNLSDKQTIRYVSGKNVESQTGANSNSEENARTRTGFDPFDSLITSSNRNPNGYSLNVFECPVCGRGYGSEEEVSGHIEHCLSLSGSGAVEESLDDKNGLDAKSELETCVSAYVSGKPSEGSLEVILKLFKNVIKEPDNAKFRKIRMGNPKIKEAIGDVAGAVELLECVGFNLEEENGEMWAVMGVPSQDMLISIKNVVSLLEPPNGEELPSTAPEKDETGKPKDVEPKEIDRQIRVFVSVSESTAAKIDLPDSFYHLSREEVKREANMRKKKIDESQLLIPKSYREKQAKASRKKHTKTVIRVQFPDGVVLQGIFLPSEPTTALYEFVSAALKDPSLEFELMHPVPIKKRVIPHSPPAQGQRPITLEEEDLVPAAFIKCRPIETESAVFTGLCNELLEIIEPFSSQP